MITYPQVPEKPSGSMGDITEAAAPTLLCVLELPKPLPTPNSRLHHMARASMVRMVRQSTAMQIRSAMARHDIPRNTDHRLVVTLVLLRGQREKMMDDDNATAACKPVRDGLVDAGLAVNDTARWMRCAVDQSRTNRDTRWHALIEVYLWDVVGAQGAAVYSAPE